MDTHLDFLLPRRHHLLLPLLAAGDVIGACGALGSNAPGLHPHSTLWRRAPADPPSAECMYRAVLSTCSAVQLRSRPRQVWKAV